MHVEQLMVEKLIPLNSSDRIWGHQSSEQGLTFFRSLWMVRNVKVLSRSGLDLVLQVSDVHGVPRRLSENHLIETDSH